MHMRVHAHTRTVTETISMEQRVPGGRTERRVGRRDGGKLNGIKSRAGEVHEKGNYQHSADGNSICARTAQPACEPPDCSSDLLLAEGCILSEYSAPAQPASGATAVRGERLNGSALGFTSVSLPQGEGEILKSSRNRRSVSPRPLQRPTGSPALPNQCPDPKPGEARGG